MSLLPYIARSLWHAVSICASISTMYLETWSSLVLRIRTVRFERLVPSSHPQNAPDRWNSDAVRCCCSNQKGYRYAPDREISALARATKSYCIWTWSILPSCHYCSGFALHLSPLRHEEAAFQSIRPPKPFTVWRTTPNT